MSSDTNSENGGEPKIQLQNKVDLAVVDGNVYLPFDTEYRLGTRASGISPAERVKTKDCISSRKRFLLPW